MAILSAPSDLGIVCLIGTESQGIRGGKKRETDRFIARPKKKKTTARALWKRIMGLSSRRLLSLLYLRNSYSLLTARALCQAELYGPQHAHTCQCNKHATHSHFSVRGVAIKPGSLQSIQYLRTKKFALVLDDRRIMRIKYLETGTDVVKGSRRDGARSAVSTSRTKLLLACVAYHTQELPPLWLSHLKEETYKVAGLLLLLLLLICILS